MSNVHHLHEDDDLAAALAEAPDIAERAPPPPVANEANVRWADTPLAKQWARFRGEFAEAMEGGLYSVDDLELMIQTGAAYFWPGKASAVVAQRVTYPSGEAVMQTLWAVGEAEEVLALAPGIEATARLVGCSSMLVEGRAGWAKILKANGYAPWSVTLRKAL